MIPKKKRKKCLVLPVLARLRFKCDEPEVIEPVDLCAGKPGLFVSVRFPSDVILKTHYFIRFVRRSGRMILSGFHSLIEKDCLPVLLRGLGPVIIVQGRRLSTSRLPSEWQKASEAGHPLLLSQFNNRKKRVTAQLAEERNRFVAALTDEGLIAYAHAGGTTEKLAVELLKSGKRVYTFDSPASRKLIEWE